jgi:uncharacterized protein
MMNLKKDYPGFWHAVLLCGTFVAVQIFLTIPFAIVDVIFKRHLVSHPAMIGVVNLAACTVVVIMGRLIGKTAITEMFAFRRVSGLAVAGVIIASGGAIILLSEVDNLVRIVLPPPELFVRIMRELVFSPEHVWASLFLLVVVAPVTEEVMFRGLILRGFLRRFNVAAAFVLSSMLFGLVHMNPWQFVSATALGVLFAWWYARTQSLIPSMIGHALINATVAGCQSLPFKIRGFNEMRSFGSTELQPFWFDALGLLLLVIGLALFRSAMPPIKAGVEISSAQASPPGSPTSEVPPVIPPGGGISL